METRRLGRTGHASSVAILGGAACARATAEQAGAWLEVALAAGINHLDIAPQYGAAETVVGAHLADKRDRLFVAGKTLLADPAEVDEQFDTTRRLLHADMLDLYQAHAVTSPAELDRRGRAIEHIVSLRESGRTRFAGITGHDVTVPVTFLEALRRYDLDTVMFPIYPALWARPEYREPAEELLELCAARDVGVMVIKAVAVRRWESAERADRWATSWYEPAASDDAIARGVRFALSTPGVHGFCTPGDIALLPRVVEAAERFGPMGEAERADAVAAMAGEELIFPMAR